MYLIYLMNAINPASTARDVVVEMTKIRVVLRTSQYKRLWEGTIVGLAGEVGTHQLSK